MTFGRRRGLFFIFIRENKLPENFSAESCRRRLIFVDAAIFRRRPFNQDDTVRGAAAQRRFFAFFFFLLYLHLSYYLSSISARCDAEGVHDVKLRKIVRDVPRDRNDISRKRRGSFKVNVDVERVSDNSNVICRRFTGH